MHFAYGTGVKEGSSFSPITDGRLDKSRRHLIAMVYLKADH
jgi:hypothetical protein